MTLYWYVDLETIYLTLKSNVKNRFSIDRFRKVKVDSKKLIILLDKSESSFPSLVTHDISCRIKLTRAFDMLTVPAI